MAEANFKPTDGGGFSEDAKLETKTKKKNLTSAEGISGREWYSQEALRAVNQAMSKWAVLISNLMMDLVQQ